MMRILVVEDDYDIRELVASALEEDGHEVRAVENGRAALDVLAWWTPHLIVLDLRMPVLDGWSFVRAYEARPGPHARILVMTAAPDAEVSASEVHADAFLSKPFELQELFARVRPFEGAPPT